MEISPAFLTFLGAIIGAMIGATLAPFVQWQVEKRRHRLSYRKELIANWRKLFERFNDSKISGLPDEEITYQLVKHSDFIIFMEYSRRQGNRQLPKGEEEFLENALIHPLIHRYMRETVRLEKEWGLV